MYMLYSENIKKRLLQNKKVLQE